MPSQKRKLDKMTDPGDSLVSKAFIKRMEVLEKERDGLLQERDKLLKSNRDQAMTIKNLERIIQKHGPRLVCPTCFAGASTIKLLNRHFRESNHGLPGMGGLPNGDMCFACGDPVLKFTAHLRQSHPEKYKRWTCEQLRLRESKVKDGDPVIELPEETYEPTFVAGVRNDEDVPLAADTPKTTAEVRNDEDVPLAADTPEKTAEVAEFHSSSGKVDTAQINRSKLMPEEDYDIEDPEMTSVEDTAFTLHQGHLQNQHYGTHLDTQQPLMFALGDQFAFIGPT
jgi:hypothetical protein